MKNRGRQKSIAILLSCILVIGLIPTTVFAETTSQAAEKSIQPGTSGIQDPVREKFQNDERHIYYVPSDYVYYGTYNNTPVKWRVLDSDEDNTGQAGMFLLSEYLLEKETFGNNNAWTGSTLRNWCNTFANDNLTAEESAEVSVTRKDTEREEDLYGFSWSANSLERDKMFVLSARELYDYVGTHSSLPALKAYYYDSTSASDFWWLRSPQAQTSIVVGTVDKDGSVYSSSSGENFAVRPACNLNLGNVLFSSAAQSGKMSDVTDGDSLRKISAYNGNEWKLTLQDDARDTFRATTAQDSETTAKVGYDNWKVKVDYENAKTGDKEYVSALLCDENGEYLYYGNIAKDSAAGSADVTIPTGLAMGDYNLHIFSEQCNGDKKTDYASAFKTIPLKVDFVKLEMPNANFVADSDNSGTLKAVESGMKYSVDGGTDWKDISAQAETITNVTAAGDIKIKRAGDGIVTADSDVQTIDVTQALAPTGIVGSSCTNTQQNDGKISGVDSTMEYRVSVAGANIWTPVPNTIVDSTLTGLSNGTYQVRVKASGTTLASPAVEITVDGHICAASGDWQFDDTSHWKLCSCGVKLDETEHAGGTATCTQEAVCTTCNQSYGQVNPENHTGEAVWVQTETSHKKIYNCCQKVIENEQAHTWENGICSGCNYPCVHSGGTATCSQLAVCGKCTSEYGSLDPDNHKPENSWTQEEGKHYHKCEYGCGVHLEEDICSGGTATCVARAVCQTCANEYGTIDTQNHTALVKVDEREATHIKEGNITYWHCTGCVKYYKDSAAQVEINLADTVIPKVEGHSPDNTGWHSDESGHWNNCECGARINETTHSFEWIVDKQATVTEKGSKHEECTECGYKKAAVEIPVTGTATEPTKPTDSSAKPGSTTNAQTGDDNKIVLWVLVMLVAGGGAAGIIIYKKKNK